MLRKTMNKWVVTAWFMLWGSVLSVTFAQNYGSLYRGNLSSPYVVYSGNNPTMSPAYQFKSTSAYTFGVNDTYTPEISEPFSAGPAKIGRRNMLGDPDDDGGDGYGIGEIASQLPVGEPFVLLLMAFLYLLYRRKHSSHISH